MEVKYYVCKHCGNIIEKVKDLSLIHILEVDKSQQNIEDGGNAQEDSSNDQKIDSLDTESGSPDISNGKLSADEVNLRLRQVVTDDHRQQMCIRDRLRINKTNNKR